MWPKNGLIKNNICLTEDKIKKKFLIESLREAATHNDLSSKFASIEKLDDLLCQKITGESINILSTINMNF
jgi:hypothetical protein